MRKTPFGLIPDSWKIGDVADAGKVVTGNTPPTADLTNYGTAYPFVTPKEVGARRFVIETSRGLSTTGGVKARLLSPGTVVFVCIGSTIGKVSQISSQSATNQQINAITCNGSNDSGFLYYQLDFRAPRIRQLAGTQAVPIISKGLFSQVPLLFPPLPEQKKIAEILGACDEAIEAQERLIAQKQQRKKGLMQKLLTGEVRFPEFEGATWREVRLGDVGSVTGAGVDKKSNPEEVPVRLVNYMDVYRNPFITNGLLAHTVTAPEKKAKQCSTKKGDVFFTPSSEKPTDIANSAVALEDIPDAVYSYHVVRLRLKEDWDLRFRAYAFTTDEFMRQAERICEGSGTRYVISLEDFRNIKVSVPSKEEQSAISSVLSACDEEITLQQTKLEQLKQQKKGLMQQLLTGKVRVKV